VSSTGRTCANEFGDTRKLREEKERIVKKTLKKKKEGGGEKRERDKEREIE